MAATDKTADLRVSPVELVRMEAAAAVVEDCRHALNAASGGILGQIAADGTVIEDWRHYPAGEVYDAKSHAQYFYHAHPAIGRLERERGHFHTFLRAAGMPSWVAPLVLPETAVAAAPPPQAAPLEHGMRDGVSHLVALALDWRGEPVRLFTTNRWVTGETWYRAEDVILMLDRFVLGEAGPSALLNRWLGAMIVLFRPQIAALLRARDEAAVLWRRRRRSNVFEDTRIETMSSLEIGLDAQLAFLDRVRSLPAAALRPVPGLPPMAEGWGEGHAG